MIYNKFLKVATICPVLEVGNPQFNAKEMLALASNSNASINLFPELSLTGYHCGDLFLQSSLLNDVLIGLKYFVDNNQSKGINIIGAPIEIRGSLYNCAVVIYHHEILGVVPKHALPNSKEFSEKRWFKSGLNTNDTSITLFNKEYLFGDLKFVDEKNGVCFGIELCEDLFAPISKSSYLSMDGCNMVFNLSASNDYLYKSEIRHTLVLDNSIRNALAYIYVSSGIHESSSEGVCSGHTIIASCGKILNEAEKFSSKSEIVYTDIDISALNFIRRQNTNLHSNYGLPIKYQEIKFNLEQSSFIFEKKFDQTPFVPKVDIKSAFERIANIQEKALYKRLKHMNCQKIIIGVSGGLDSTLALLVAVQTFKFMEIDLKNIIAVTMPGLATSVRTKSNAMSLMEQLGVTILNKPINEAVIEHFKLIGHDENTIDVTYENTQARIRTLILMNLANMHNGLVLGTGDLSELALGWCTYNGDQMSMYGINAGIPKTLVKFMVENYATYVFGHMKRLLIDIIKTPISPELSSTTQKTEDSVGKYEVNDFILYRFLNYGDDEEINGLFKKLFHSMKKKVKNMLKYFFIVSIRNNLSGKLFQMVQRCYLYHFHLEEILGCQVI